MTKSLKLAFLCLICLAFVCVKCWPSGVEVDEKCRHLELGSGNYGIILGSRRYNGCYLACALETSGVIERLTGTLFYESLYVSSFRFNVCIVT
jgi:hypothetical protein